MDDFDLHILASLQQNAKLSTQALGDQIGLSATACQRRIKKLRDRGVIKKEVAVLDATLVGSYVTVIVSVIMKQGGAAIIDNFRTSMLEHDEVQQCYYVTGDADFILIIAAANMLQYEKITRKLFFNNSNIQRFSSSVAMENVKVGLDIPMHLS